MSGRIYTDFDEIKANYFNVDKKIIIKTGEEVILKK